MSSMKWYGKIVTLLCGIAALSLGITAFTGVPYTVADGIQVVTSFYPVYIAAKQVAGDIDGVQVVNLVEDQVGCLHDYQLSPDDRIELADADVLVMNGAGAEPFLAAVKDTVPTVIDLSAGAALLESEHTHEHEHEHGEGGNAHLWVSPLHHREQIAALAEGLAAADPVHAQTYRRNADAYIAEIDAVWARMQAAAKNLQGMPTVVFHDSLAYPAEDLQLNVVAALNVGEDSGVSAHELAQTEQALRGASSALFLYDSQYDTVQYTYLQDLCENVVAVQVDTCVAGADDAERWLSAMTAFCEELEAAA